MSRVGSNKRTNKDFERLGYLIEEIREDIASATTTTASTGNALTTPEPHIPFKLAERADVDGIYITVRVNIPDKTEELRILLIRKEENSTRSGEDTPTAIARARRQAKKTTFRVPVSEDEQAAGFVEAEIGPLKPKKNSSDNAYQLIRLIALDDAGSFAKNPEANPFTGDAFPFPALTVRNDGGSDEANRYFTVGEAVLEIPSTPKAADFVETSADDDTEEADAFAVFKVYASEAAPTKTFREIGVNQAFVVLRRKRGATVGAGDDTDANADVKLPKYGGAVENLDQPFTYITVRGLKLGRRYLWTRNITIGGLEPNKSAAAEVEFIAGWGTLAGSVFDITRCTDWQLTLTPINKRHSKVRLSLKQPDPNAAAPANRPVLLKNARLYQKITQAGDGVVSADWENIGLEVLRGEDGYSSNTTTVPPATDSRTKIVEWKVNHPARARDQYYVAVRAVGNDVMYVGSNFGQIPPGQTGGITPLSRSGTTGDDTAPSAPSDPNTDDVVENTPDTGSAENDAIVVLRVYADATKTLTFSQANAKEVYAVVRRDTATPTKRYKIGGPLTEDELASTHVLLELPRLKLGKRYRWVKNFSVSTGGVKTENAGTNEVLIYAGNRAEDTTVTGFAITSVTAVDSRHSKVDITFTQTTPPTVLKRLVLLGKTVSESTFIKLDTEDLSDNTTVQGAGTHTLTLLAKHPKNTTMQYKGRLVRGDATSIETAVFTATSQDEGVTPPLGISHPASADLNQSVNVIDTDEDIATAQVQLRVYASDSNRSGGTVTFSAQNTDAVYVVLREDGASSDRIKAGGALTTEEKAATSVLVNVPDLVIGKTYRWNYNIAANAGGNKVSGTGTPANVALVPGNFTFTPTNSQITFGTLTAIDSNSTAVPVTITQPSQPVRLRTLKIEKQFDGDGVWRDETRFSLLEDPDLLTGFSSKTFNVVVTHPKRIGATGALKVRATLVAVRGASAFKDATLTGVGEDLGSPAWSVTPTPTFKFRSIGMIRSKCPLPNINANTLKGAKVCVYFFESKRLSTFGDTGSGIVNGSRYIFWDPFDDNLTSGTRYWHSTVSTFNPESGFAGGLPLLGISNRALIELDKPAYTGNIWTAGSGEVHHAIMTELSYVYNNSSPPPTTQMGLFWAFTNEIGTSQWLLSSVVNWPF